VSTNLKPLCVVQTSDQGIKFFAAHDPILGKNKPDKVESGPLRLNISYDGVSVGLQFCKRCGVAYVEAHSITFGEPLPTSITSPSGGNA
jgi:hypothetical protein